MILSVIIPSRDSSNLVRCVAAMNEQEGTALSRGTGHILLLIIDDGLENMEHATPCYFRKGVKPFVFARNINIGIREAMQRGSDGVVLLNDDALLESPGGFSLLAKAAEEHPEFGIIGATTNVTGQPLQYRQGIGLREVPHIAFVCVYIPRRTIEQVGLLDERYCLDYGVDDRDYCEAVRRAGLKVGVHDHCFVDHGSLTSSFRGDPKTPKSFAQNYALFLAKCEYCDQTGEAFRAGVGMEVAA